MIARILVNEFKNNFKVNSKIINIHLFFTTHLKFFLKKTLLNFFSVGYLI